jgi:hypothetical protein
MDTAISQPYLQTLPSESRWLPFPHHQTKPSAKMLSIFIQHVHILGGNPPDSRKNMTNNISGWWLTYPSEK